MIIKQETLAQFALKIINRDRISQNWILKASARQGGSKMFHLIAADASEKEFSILTASRRSVCRYRLELAFGSKIT